MGPRSKAARLAAGSAAIRRKRDKVRSELRRAVDEQEFALHYQARSSRSPSSVMPRRLARTPVCARGPCGRPIRQGGIGCGGGSSSWQHCDHSDLDQLFAERKTWCSDQR